MLISAWRPGTAADAVDGVVPRHVAEPETANAFAETLADASRERLQTVIRGGGTKLGWGRLPAAVDLLISTARLNRLIVHRHGDLTATVQAGMPLTELNRVLRLENQYLPVESAFDRTTVGGLVASNDAGPSRHRNGTPRDLVIGISLALTDGRLVKAGGTVVKNVAGYDLGKLVSGSYGSLAGIVDVTFKLVPMPHASATLVASYSDPSTMARDVAAVAGSQLEPAAFDVRVSSGGGRPPLSLLVRFASSPAATDAQIAVCRTLLSGDTTMAAGEEEAAVWMNHLGAPWEDGGAVVRLSWLPTKLPQALALATDVERSTGAPATLVGRASGVGLLRFDGHTRGQADTIARLRVSGDFGHVVALRASRDLKDAIDVWGAGRESDRIARALKQMFDPAGILNAGRGPI